MKKRNMKKTYIPFSEGKPYFPKMNFNKRGFYKNEIQDILNNKELIFDKIICIEEEVEKYNLKELHNNNLGLDEKVYLYQLWSDAYNNKVLNDFNIPIKVKNTNEYMEKLEDTFNEYIKYLDRPAFIYEKDLYNFIKKECEKILETLKYLIEGKHVKAEEILKEILNIFVYDKFLINELDKTYSFRGSAPFYYLHDNGDNEKYKKMINKELTFFRVRTTKKYEKNEIKEVEQMLHIPYNKRDIASSMRFNVEKSPALYLSTNTYVCAKESNWDQKTQNLFASVFIPNEDGKKLKILNLTISQALINGIYNLLIDDNNEIRKKMQISMLKIFPIVIATSFSVENEDEGVKYHYLLSQALMRVANEIKIDGIAYFSMKGKDEFQFPHGVNLAILATDISDDIQYSSKCKGFKISKPILYCRQEENEFKSYINEVFNKSNKNGIESFTSKLYMDGEYKFYEETEYAKFDNFLTKSLYIT